MNPSDPRPDYDPAFDYQEYIEQALERVDYDEPWMMIDELKPFRDWWYDSREKVAHGCCNIHGARFAEEMNFIATQEEFDDWCIDYADDLHGLVSKLAKVIHEAREAEKSRMEKIINYRKGAIGVLKSDIEKMQAAKEKRAKEKEEEK